jgi:hypothetical protein
MADDLAVQNIVVTSLHFRKLAKSAGETLNKAVQEKVRSAGETPGFIPIDIDDHKETLQDVTEQFEKEVCGYWLHECPKTM